MTLRDLGPQAPVWRNICYQQHQFLLRGLGDMSSDGQTDTTTTVCSPEFFSGSIKFYVPKNRGILSLQAVIRKKHSYYSSKRLTKCVVVHLKLIKSNEWKILCMKERYIENMCSNFCLNRCWFVCLNRRWFVYLRV
jgi:hypothetical protein